MSDSATATARQYCTEAKDRGPRAPKRPGAAGPGRVVTLAAVAIGLLAGTFGAAPEPEPVPRRWELQVQTSPLQVTSVDVPGVGARPFVYVTYHVVNNSGQEVLLAPAFELSTGEGRVQRSGRNVPQAVTTELMRRTQNPFIQDQVSIIGDILQGEEHARDGIAVWPLIEFRPQDLTVYAAGFSGESRTVTSPDGKEKFVLRKTLRLDFEAPGDLARSGGRTLELLNRQWIMR